MYVNDTYPEMRHGLTLTLNLEDGMETIGIPITDGEVGFSAGSADTAIVNFNTEVEGKPLTAVLTPEQAFDLGDTLVAAAMEMGYDIEDAEHYTKE